MQGLAELLNALSSLAWPGLAVWTLVRFEPEIRELIMRLRRGKVLGLEFELAELEKKVVSLEQEVSSFKAQIEAMLEGHHHFGGYVDLFTDPAGLTPLPEGLRGVMLYGKSVEGGVLPHVQVTRRADYAKGDNIVMEYNDMYHGAAWYRDPETSDIKEAWNAGQLILCGDAVGRPTTDPAAKMPPQHNF